jgi:YbbR domain-containing protein
MRFNLRENLPLKIFSLLVAVLAWLVVHGEEERLRDFVVPLDYVNLSPSFDISGELVDTVTVRLRAPEVVLKTITEDSISAPIDLSQLPAGEQRIDLTEKMITVPGGAQVVRITPAMVTLTIEERATREVPVVAEFAGLPADGYHKVAHSIEPAMVTIAGPASQVDSVRRVMTGTIVLEGETGDMEVQVRPIPEAPPGNRVRVVSPRDQVRVMVQIAPDVPGSEDDPERSGAPGDAQ